MSPAPLRLRSGLIFEVRVQITAQKIRKYITVRAHRSEREAHLLGWRERRARIEREIDWLHAQRFARDASKPLRLLRRQLDHLGELIGAT